jgi:hypothetical protein
MLSKIKGTILAKSDFWIIMVNDQEYLKIFLKPIKKCKDYKPKMGDGHNSQGISVDDFLRIYGSDPFYSWIGLDSGLMYAAHKAAGGMTSIYRQIGKGCENLFRQIICDATEYEDPSYCTWSYVTKTAEGAEKTLTLDARIEIEHILNPRVKKNVAVWLVKYCRHIEVANIPPNGIVFEIRQGYKSKDSKRQHGDIDNALNIYAAGYLPVFGIFSSQIDNDLVFRYKSKKCGVLIGSNSTNPYESLFAFSANVLGYNLAGFFERNSKILKREIEEVLAALLNPK